MSTYARLTAAEFEKMVDRGAFDSIGPKKIELLDGELRFMDPAGPIHDDYIIFLTDWSYEKTDRAEVSISVQSGFACEENRPEPDILWLKPRRYGRDRPTAADVLLLIEVADHSLSTDLSEKANMYARGGIAEYWVCDVPGSRLHVMKASDGVTYRDIQIVEPPAEPSPQCMPHAKLDLAALFQVR